MQRNVQFVRGSIVINKGASSTTSTTVTIDLSYLPAPPASQDKYHAAACSTTRPGQPPTTFASRKTVTLPAGDGVKTISVRFVDDKLAVSAFYSDTIILDTKVPLGSITINNGAAVTTSATVTLNLAVTDVNGVVKMQFSNNGTTWSSLEPFAVKAAWTLPATPGHQEGLCPVRGQLGQAVRSGQRHDPVRREHDRFDDAQVIIKNNEPYTTTATVALAIAESPVRQ